MMVIFKPRMDLSIRSAKKFRASSWMPVTMSRGSRPKEESLKSLMGLMKVFFCKTGLFEFMKLVRRLNCKCPYVGD